jgi:hypothetical protein
MMRRYFVSWDKVQEQTREGARRRIYLLARKLYGKGRIEIEIGRRYSMVYIDGASVAQVKHGKRQGLQRLEAELLSREEQ